MEVVTTEAMRHAKFQSNCHHQKTSTHLIRGQMPFLWPNQQQCQSTEWTNDNLAKNVQNATAESQKADLYAKAQN